MATSDLLGTARTVTLSSGTIDYRDRGDGPPVLLLHGLMVNGDLWRNVVPSLVAAGHRCITLDLPLGGHRTPMPPDADLSPTGLADLISEVLDVLDLDDVTVVANDSAGALTQIVMTRRHERIGRVVLVSCDLFDRFFSWHFNYLTTLLRVPGSTWLLSRVAQVGALQRLPLVFGYVSRRPVPPAYVASYLDGLYADAGIRHDLRSFVTQVHRRYTQAAARELSSFEKPVLVAWAREDRLFPVAMGRRLAELLPQGRFVEIPDSYTFVPEDQPERLAAEILEFVAADVRSPE